MIENFQKRLKGVLKKDFTVSKFSWFKVGGKAQYFYSPTDIEDLRNFLKYRPKDYKITILGAGSNVLIKDKGIKGFVLRLNNFNNISKVDDITFKVDTGVMNISMANFALDNSCTSFEFLSGIPGSIGGAIAMNAGCFGLEFKDICLEVEALDMQGNSKIFSLEEMGFSYRFNSLDNNYIFTRCKLQGKMAKQEEIKSHMREIEEIRISSQPKKVKTGGSTFANPKGYKAWQLIDKVGLRGYKIGGAFFSDKHCNFIINDGTATSCDIENLILEAQKRVKENFDIDLKTEIKIIGE